MDILSVSFLLFLIGLLVIYYLVPKRWQWIVLLVASLGFYALGGVLSLLWPCLTAVTIWAAARAIGRDAAAQKDWLKAHKADCTKEEKDRYKAKAKARRRRILVLALVFNFGILCAFKYVHFLLAQLNTAAGWFGCAIEDRVSWVVPLGISFYTFQATGYLLDVYWGRVEAERSVWRVLLFTSFFPQITQGPISTYADLGRELFAEHTFSYHEAVWGAERLIWGFFKKMVVANTLSGMVGRVFADFSGYTGPAALLGALCYSAQIYADFSGYMDIMCGLCQMLGIRLTENFERPYFSKSVAEYWRRWHISLGAWFKNYLYYPIAVSRWNQKLGKTAKKRLGKAFGNYLPATLALVLVWLTTGLWHGASWAYIAWGGVNGLFIIFSMWMEGPYDRLKQALHIREQSRAWRLFQVVRTFLLVTLIKVLPEVGTLADGFGLIGRIFTGGLSRDPYRLIPFVQKLSELWTVLFGVGLMLLVSLVQRKEPFRDYLARRVPYGVRIMIFAALFFLILYLGVPASGGGGFLYAQF